MKWLLDTQYQSIIAWLASSIAFFIGIIELLPEITTRNTLGLNTVLSAIWVSLPSFGCISVYRVSALIEEKVTKEHRIETRKDYQVPDDLKVKFWVQSSFLRHFFVNKSEEGQFIGLKWRYIYIGLGALALIWLVVLSMKLGLSF